MNDWKNHLYENYVSSGQAGGSLDRGSRISSHDYPYFQRIINKHLPFNKDVAIADIACGHGALLHCLRESGYRNISGVDVSLEQVELAHQFGVVEAVCGDMGGFLRDKAGAFDVIFLMDILEHLERAELFELLGLVSLSLKEGGLVVIHVPNGAGLHGMRIRYGDLTHENCFTPQSIQQALGSSGFVEIRSHEDKPVVHGLKSFMRSVLWRILTIPHRLLLLAETGQAGHILSQNMLVAARKTSTRNPSGPALD